MLYVVVDGMDMKLRLAAVKRMREDLMHVASVLQNKAELIAAFIEEDDTRKEMETLVNDLFTLIEVAEDAE
jgi:hypothetical protein